MKSKTTLGSRVKSLRETYGLSQESFGRYINISYVAVANIEKEKTLNPHSDTMSGICSVYGTTMSWLEKEEGKMLPEGKRLLNVRQTVNDLYQDALYKELKQDKETWQQKYNELFQMFSKIIDRGGLGKSKSLSISGLYKNNRKRVSVN